MLQDLLQIFLWSQCGCFKNPLRCCRLNLSVGRLSTTSPPHWVPFSRKIYRGIRSNNVTNGFPASFKHAGHLPPRCKHVPFIYAVKVDQLFTEQERVLRTRFLSERNNRTQKNEAEHKNTCKGLITFAVVSHWSRASLGYPKKKVREGSLSSFVEL